MVENDLMDLDEPPTLAVRIKVTVGTLANWRWKGVGPRFVKVGRKCLYRRADVSAWLEEQTRTSTSDKGPGGGR